MTIDFNFLGIGSEASERRGFDTDRNSNCDTDLNPNCDTDSNSNQKGNSKVQTRISTPDLCEKKTPLRSPFQSPALKKRASSEFKTPLAPQLIHTVNSTRVTPPLCECGRRCKRKQVINPGPNIGRIFYSCSLQSPKDRSNGCRFYKWEAQKSIDHGGTDNQVLDRRAALKEKCMKLYNC